MPFRWSLKAFHEVQRFLEDRGDVRWWVNSSRGYGRISLIPHPPHEHVLLTHKSVWLMARGTIIRKHSRRVLVLLAH